MKKEKSKEKSPAFKRGNKADKHTFKKIQAGDEEFKDILEEEKKWLKKRREKARMEVKDPGKDAVGLALSGGGIRSATFNLGLLQALESAQLLKEVDYLSTVSGGGYIGSCLTWLKLILGEFPFGTRRKDHERIGGKVLAWLRDHGKYLTPGQGLNVWALLGAILSGVLVNLLILVPPGLLLFRLLSGEIVFAPPLIGLWEIKVFRHVPADTIFSWLLWFGFIYLLSFLVFIIIFALGTRIRTFRRSTWQKRIHKWNGELLKFGILLVAVGSIPLVYSFLKCQLPNWIEGAMSGISLSGIIALAGARPGRKRGKETEGKWSFLLTLGLSLLIYGLFLWFYHLVNGVVSWWFILAGLVLSVILVLFSDINYVCMHRFYRNRLMECYMPEKTQLQQEEPAGAGENSSDGQAKAEKNPDQFLLAGIPPADTPFQIVNTNLQTVGSSNYTLRGRGGDSFIFSPLYCGSDSTRYVKTSQYIGGQMDLATAFAISGAAVDPNTYATRSRPLSFLMALLNVRLGYWIINPGFPQALKASIISPGRYRYLLAELLGAGLKESQKYIHLSDGGHFENLGLYELIRRHCRYIIISDAAADKEWQFGDLGKLVEMIRVDFGAKLEIDTRLLIPDPRTQLSNTAFVHGEVTYKNGDISQLVYIKTTMIDNLPEDLCCYKRSHADFPDQSTLDQFFDQRQFEAYRELGFRIGETLIKGSHENIRALFA